MCWNWKLGASATINPAGTVRLVGILMLGHFSFLQSVDEWIRNDVLFFGWFYLCLWICWKQSSKKKWMLVGKNVFCPRFGYLFRLTLLMRDDHTATHVDKRSDQKKENKEPIKTLFNHSYVLSGRCSFNKQKNQIKTKNLNLK